LGAEEIALTRAAIGWNHAPFEMPKEVYADWNAATRGKAQEAEWKATFAAYKAAHPALAKELLRRMAGELPKNFAQTVVDTVIDAHTKAETVASRKASQLALEHFTAALPELLGGSADLTGSNLTNTKSTPNLRFDAAGRVVKNDAGQGGRHINYGVREFGMAAIMNGMALHGGFIPYGGTFLTFSDYCKPSIRLAALMKQRSIFVMTHDSIGLGEDGPTHQPIEHLMSMRATPNLQVFRPMDTIETAEAWDIALRTTDAPSMIVLSRQDLPTLRKDMDMNHTAHGGYILSDSLDPKVTILATGSEVSIAMNVMDLLKTYKIACKVVSLPCFELFDKQSKEYRQKVLSGELLVSIEAGTTFGWEKYVGLEGLRFGIDTFGASAPAAALYEYFGLTPEIITEKILMRLKNDA
jgi:transketolase